MGANPTSATNPERRYQIHVPLQRIVRVPEHDRYDGEMARFSLLLNDTGDELRVLRKESHPNDVCIVVFDKELPLGEYSKGARLPLTELDELIQVLTELRTAIASDLDE